MDSTTIHVVVKIQPILGKEKELRERMVFVAQETQREAGCTSYELFESDKESTTLYFLGEWANQAALDAHNLTEHVKDFRKDQSSLAQELSVTALYKV